VSWLHEPVFLKAMVLGFCVAAPIGPVGILCINRSLGGGAVLGLATGLGASTVQVGWILIATAGAASSLIIRPDSSIAHLASLSTATLLIWMGISAIRRGGNIPPGLKAAPTLLVCLTTYTSGVVLAASNPVTGILFITAAPTITPFGTGSFETKIALATGTFLGSAIWWAALSGCVAMFRSQLRPSIIQIVNRGSGVLLLSLAGGVLAKVV
jgi:threonine/homoserine/homoserine lactone efflux protein